jgi:hypothetical protein
MRFCGHVPNSPRNKNLKRLISYLLEKVVFLDPKRLLSPFCKGEKNFFSTLNVMIIQMVRNESVRFGRHIDIEVSYKILRLKYQNWFKICTIWLAFKRGCLEMILSKNTLRPLGVKSISFMIVITLFLPS